MERHRLLLPVLLLLWVRVAHSVAHCLERPKIGGCSVRNSPVSGRCPVEYCQYNGLLSGHHIYPRRYRRLWTKDQRTHVQWLCRECHTEFEKILELYERNTTTKKREPLPWIRYSYLFREFLLGRLPRQYQKGG